MTAPLFRLIGAVGAAGRRLSVQQPLDQTPPVGDRPSSVHPTLEDLLARCAHRDREAFAEFYRITSPVLFALSVNRGHSRETVEEALVWAYVIVWREARRFSRNRVCSAWVWLLAILEPNLPAANVRFLGSFQDRRMQ